MSIDYEEVALVEANQLDDAQYQKFLEVVEQQPAKRSPISGQVCRLGFEFMEDVGTRITETLFVRKRDIDFRTRIVTITNPKSTRKCKCSIWEYRDLHTRHKVLKSSDPNCKICGGKGKWKKPQRTTFTPRLFYDLKLYCDTIESDDLLWPVSRQSFWNWGKAAGKIAEINIFTQKDEKLIVGVYNHLFRGLCSKRTTADSVGDKYQNQLIDVKMRHAVDLRDRYNRPDINYLIAWEQKTYVDQ